MKKIILSILIVLLCIFSFTLISCGGEDDTTTTADPDLFNITYELNGGTNNENNPTTYKAGDSFELAVPTKEDGLFLGWYTDSEFRNFVTEIKDDSVGDITLYAKWTDLEWGLSFELVDDSYRVTNCSKSLTYLFIPSTYKGLPVTSISYSASKKNVNLVYAYIPDSVTSIGYSAFSGCKKLKNIRLSNNLTGISSSMFYGCKSLETIDLPESITTIGSDAFSSSGLTGIVIPDNVTIIENGAFSNCKNLSHIQLSKELDTVKNAVFSGCLLLESITVDEENTSYKSVDGVLYTKDSKALICYPAAKTETEYTVLNGTEVIEQQAFVYNSFLKRVSMPNTVKSIKKYAFSQVGIESITIPESVTIIGVSAFYKCADLKNVVLSNGVETIDSNAFDECTALESITIPSSVKKIGFRAFGNCTSLKNLIIEEGVSEIDTFTFLSCEKLESVVIPNSVKTIKIQAFDRCSSIKKIYISKGTEVIENSAFIGCPDATVYCEAEAKPDGWDVYWNSSVKEVVWGYKGEE